MKKTKNPPATKKNSGKPHGAGSISLREAHRDKTDALAHFSGCVAHDFNNLLAVIRGYCTLALQKMNADNPVRPRLEAIHAVSNEALDLVSQLLAIGRRRPLQPQTFDLHLHLNRCREMMGQLLGDKKHLTLCLGAKELLVEMDRHQLDQILVNLVLNARDALSEDGALTLRTGICHHQPSTGAELLELAPGQYAVLTLADTGSGMSPETLKQAFDPFFTTKPRGKGIGLGLSTALGLVRQSGGDITLSSQHGKGTTVTLYLPIGSEEPAASDSGKKSSKKTHSSQLILVAENRESLRKLIADALIDQGFQVLEAGDGEQALQLCERHSGKIGLVFTDIVMPNLGGLELTERLANVAPKVPVLYTSGYSLDPRFMKRVVQHQVNFIPKPYDVAQVVEEIRRILGH
ncbi:MAG: response regulator [Verrucomicrobiae bacterium]|nr:response regulator [Verrucomicrobiae bacterium]